MRCVFPFLVLSFCLSIPTQAEDPVYFDDASLKAAVEAELWVDDPTPTDMLGLLSLSAPNQGITSVTGLEYATNLQKLDLCFNSISDLSALSGLKSLWKLVLNNNDINNLSPLSGLTRLEHLDVHGTHRISDISPVSGLVNLRTLILRINQISDISALAGLTNLEALDLQWNSITGVSSLSGLTKLRRVQLQYNEIEDISPLVDLMSLEHLNLEGNPLEMDACEIYLPLMAANNPGIDLRYNPCVECYRLTISSTAGGSVIYPGEGEFLHENGDVVYIEAKPNDGSVFVRWSGSLSNSMNPLCLAMHQDIDIRANFASVVNPDPGAEVVTFSDSALQAAVTEALSVSAPTPADMLGLTELDCSGQGVASLAGLEYAGHLQILDASDNSISDLAPLTALTSLESLDLRGNPLSRQTYDVYIPLILARNGGVDLEYDAAVQYTVTIRSTSGGSVTRPGEGVLTYDEGETIRLEAEAEGGFAFVQWSGSYQGTANPAYLSIYDDHDIEAVFAPVAGPLYVDAGAAGDTHADGTSAHPFDSVQDAITVATDGDTIVVRSGIYRETIDLMGKSIQLTGLDPNGGPLPILDGDGSGPVVSFINGEDADCVLTGFIITGGHGSSAGAIACAQSSPIIANCLIVGNQATAFDGAALRFRNSEAVLANCTIADNIGGPQGGGLLLIDSRVVLTNSIVWGNDPDSIALSGINRPSITYCDLQGGWPDGGNVEIDPCFVRPGYWGNPDASGTQAAWGTSDTIWIAGDYHLMSETGRWDPQAQAWAQDDVTSPCIDAGDPAAPVEPEPTPHGGIVNLGTYGGTAEAGKSHLNP